MSFFPSLVPLTCINLRSIGTKHSLILFQSTRNSTQKLFGIGSNSDFVFGLGDRNISFSDTLVDIPLEFLRSENSDPMENDKTVSHVFALDTNSFVGTYKTGSDRYKMCFGVPEFLYDRVCNGTGTCVSDGTCNCKFFGLNGWTWDKQILFVFGFLGYDGDCAFSSDRFQKNMVQLVVWVFTFQIICLGFFNFFCFYKTFMWLTFLSLGSLFYLCASTFFVVSVVPSAIFVFLVVIPLRVRAKVSKFSKHQKEELLQRLLNGDDSSINGNDKSKNDELFKYDLTFFNLNFNDFKLKTDIPAGGSGCVCFDAIDKNVCII